VILLVNVFNVSFAMTFFPVFQDVFSPYLTQVLSIERFFMSFFVVGTTRWADLRWFLLSGLALQQRLLFWRHGLVLLFSLNGGSNVGRTSSAYSSPKEIQPICRPSPNETAAEGTAEVPLSGRWSLAMSLRSALLSLKSFMD